MRQRLPGRVERDRLRVEQVLQLLGEVLGLAHGRGHHEHRAARRRPGPCTTNGRSAAGPVRSSVAQPAPWRRASPAASGRVRAGRGRPDRRGSRVTPRWSVRCRHARGPPAGADRGWGTPGVYGRGEEPGIPSLPSSTGLSALTGSRHLVDRHSGAGVGSGHRGGSPLRNRSMNLTESAKYAIYRTRLLERLMVLEYPYKVDPGELATMVELDPELSCRRRRDRRGRRRQGRHQPVPAQAPQVRGRPASPVALRHLLSDSPRTAST